MNPKTPYRIYILVIFMAIIVVISNKGWLSTAQAGPVTITWNLATEREDGTPLYEYEIAGTNIWFNTSGSEWGPFLVNPDFTSLNIQASDSELCMKFATVLFAGQVGAPTDWLCMTDTPKEGE